MQETHCLSCGGWGCKLCHWSGRMMQIDLGLVLVRGVPCAALFWFIFWAIWTMLPA